MAENRVQVYKTTPRSSLWVFLHVYKVSHCKMVFKPEILCVKQGTYMPSVEYFDYKKGSHDTENHCGYLISLVSTETPSVKTI